MQATFLTYNDLFSVEQLHRAGNPDSSWLGAEHLSNEELLLLCQVRCNRQRSRSPSRQAPPPGAQLQRLLIQNQAITAQSRLREAKPPAVDVRCLGPRAAAAELMKLKPTVADKILWVWEARITPITDSVAGSKDSVQSGMRAWVNFYLNCTEGCGLPFPPHIDDLLAWSTLFRNRKTFGNYCGYVKVGCEILGLTVEVFAHPSLKRAKSAIEKRKLTTIRTPQFVRLAMIQQMVTELPARPELRELVMLLLAAYIFLLRVPSEALPMSAKQGHEVPVFALEDGLAVLRLHKRKNRLQPTVQHRPCWCAKCKLTCPVHVLGAYMQQLSPGTQPFAHLTPVAATNGLRLLLEEIGPYMWSTINCLSQFVLIFWSAGIDNAHMYRLHDLRRGHADDMRRNGATVAEICRAGDWKSAAFLWYLNMVELELDRVVEAYGLRVDESGSEGEENDSA